MLLAVAAMDADKIASFSAATGAEASRAEAFLAAFNGDVDAAVNAFFGAQPRQLRAAPFRLC